MILEECQEYIDFKYVEVYGPGCGELAFKPEELFQSSCQFCDTYNDRRKNTPIVLSSANTDAAFLCVFDLEPIYSNEFFELFTLEELKGLVRQPVQIQDVQKSYFELVGPALATAVGVENFPGFDGFECPKCGHNQFTYFHDYHFYTFLAEEDLPKPLPTVCLIRNSAGLSFCVTKERWNDLKDLPIVEGWVSEPVGIVETSRVIRHPKVPMLKKRRKLPRDVDEHCPPKDKRIDEAY